VAIGEQYADGRCRVSDLVLTLTNEDAHRTVPTCPQWTVADVVAHLTGICADILAGNVGGVATESWTAAQVLARKGRDMAQLVEEWSELAPRVESFADDFPEPMGIQWIADLTSHEHDIRTAIGEPGARDSLGVETGLKFLVTVGLDQTICAQGLAPLAIRAGETSWVVGTREDGGAGAPGAGGEALVASPFELFRALTGRRSAAQIGRLDWRIDPAPYVPAFRFGPFTTSPEDVVE
jgi:uncharacterized protein (TIGR03083 family)